MEKKCNKYEAYFTFAGEEDFQAHLAECEDCRQELEKEKRLGDLIREAEPVYNKLKQKRNLRMTGLKTACALLVFASLGLYTGTKINTAQEYQQFMQTNTETSIIADEGLPTDEYGFFDYN